MWLFQQLLSPRQEQQGLFNGLRVRMGVVTGTVEHGQELKSSELYRMAQGTYLLLELKAFQFKQFEFNLN